MTAPAAFPATDTIAEAGYLINPVNLVADEAGVFVYAVGFLENQKPHWPTSPR